VSHETPPVACPFEIRRNPWGRLVLIESTGREHVGVEPIRAFPITAPQNSLSLVDATGHEIATIDDYRQLSPQSVALLEEELGRRDFIPVIQRIISVAADVDPSEWNVITDRGPTQFCLDSDEDLRRVGLYRALLVDSHGIRYLIADIRALDQASQRILDRYF
jgi:hypothetical protein